MSYVESERRRSKRKDETSTTLMLETTHTNITTHFSVYPVGRDVKALSSAPASPTLTPDKVHLLWNHPFLFKADGAHPNWHACCSRRSNSYTCMTVYLPQPLRHSSTWAPSVITTTNWHPCSRSI